MLDKFEQVIWDAKFAVLIMGNVARKEYELVDLDAVRGRAEEAAQEFAERGLCFLGCVALHTDGPRIALDHDFDEETIRVLSAKYLKHVERKLNAQLIEPVGDSLEWLGALHTLPDLRNGMEN